jgi:DNA polymerase II large subunit
MGECLLCLEECDLLVIGKCDHQCVCYNCATKMRTKMKNNKCPVCKEELDEIVVTISALKWN